MHIKSTNISMSSAANEGQLKTPSLTNNNSSKNNTDIQLKMARIGDAKKAYTQNDSTGDSTDLIPWQEAEPNRGGV